MKLAWDGGGQAKVVKVKSLRPLLSSTSPFSLPSSVAGGEGTGKGLARRKLFSSPKQKLTNFCFYSFGVGHCVVLLSPLFCLLYQWRRTRLQQSDLIRLWSEVLVFMTKFSLHESFRRSRHAVEAKTVTTIPPQPCPLFPFSSLYDFLLHINLDERKKLWEPMALSVVDSKFLAHPIVNSLIIHSK